MTLPETINEAIANITSDTIEEATIATKIVEIIDAQNHIKAFATILEFAKQKRIVKKFTIT